VSYRYGRSPVLLMGLAMDFWVNWTPSANRDV
jgi:hypothetical protein